MPLIKLSEMYLLIAECIYDTDQEEARRYVNMLRRHRIRGNQEGAGDWMYLSREDIFKEMRREYIGEGQMWFVHKRNRLYLSGGLTGLSFVKLLRAFMELRSGYRFSLPGKG